MICFKSSDCFIIYDLDFPWVQVHTSDGTNVGRYQRRTVQTSDGTNVGLTNVELRNFLFLLEDFEKCAHSRFEAV